ncbi:15-hydroxyprostaglandin dehydrogenase [NAD(+)]-like [Anticarsia gemmatalis]|uniref:15-hydroxyprostaglandin dehydrogenase [NAD(+)]-like n=1 Tax=Anticarsia gemmatalis TaxID=129554 RepID=UPI003F76D916
MAVELVKRYLCVEDKVFLVTGGAAGVGAGIVRALLAENARHVAFLDIVDREGSLLEYELLNKFGALKAKFIKCDISDEDQLANAYKQILDKYRRLDGVINNAAVVSIDEKTYKRMVDINFTAVVNSTMKALRVMGVDHGGNGGVVLNISSLLALHLGTHLPVYAATKAAVLQFSMALGSEEPYSKTGVRVITVCFGPTDTAILNRSNWENLNKDADRLVSRVSVRQRVESAVTGILDVIDKGQSGSTWIVKNDQPAEEYTGQINEAFKILSETYM